MAGLRDKVVEIAYRLKDQFSTQVSKVTGSIRRVEKASKQSADTIERNNSRVRQSYFSLSKAVRGLLPALSISAFAANIKNTLNFADQVQKLSIRLGISTEALSQLRYAADLSGVSFNTLTLGLQRMTRRVAEAAQGTGEAKAALKELGLDAKALAQLAPDQQLEKIADAFLQVGNSSDRVRLAMKLFDSEGVSFLQIIQKGAAGLRDMREEGDKAGATISQQLADRAAEANDEVTRLTTSLNGLSQQLALTFAAPLADGADEVSATLSDLERYGKRLGNIFYDLTNESFDPASMEQWGASAEEVKRYLASLDDTVQASTQSVFRLNDALALQKQAQDSVAAAYAETETEMQATELALSGYIDQLGLAKQEADRMKQSSVEFLSDIQALLNPRDVSLTQVLADIDRANAAIDNGNLKEANRLYEQLQSDLRGIAQRGDESALSVEYWARQVSNLGQELADLQLADDTLDFTKAEQQLERLREQFEAIKQQKITVDIEVNSNALEEALQTIEQYSGGDSGGWEDLLEEATKQGR